MPDDAGLDVPGRAEAKVLAEVLIARSMAPPVSVGILGKPGSGTSFTAQLVAREVEQLSRAAGEQPPAQRAHAHPVAQIEINAWH